MSAIPFVPIIFINKIEIKMKRFEGNPTLQTECLLEFFLSLAL
jgi:hypothetical protein